LAIALHNRGVAWREKGEPDKELADYTRLIEQLPGAPVDQLAIALHNRGVAWREKGEPDKELADYTRLIEQLPGAPVDQLAIALHNRGVAWREKGEPDKELADYTRLIERLPGAPVDQVAKALGNRGWAKYTKKDYPGFLADTEAALNKLSSLDSVSFNLGLAFFACGRDAEALAAYRTAGERFPHAIEEMGVPDLEEARKSWLSDERAQPVIQLLRSLMK
jgi:tetratricopeptide (TPR) repeat protein